MYFPGKPEYVFGQGLSYTTFDYSNLSISSAKIASSGTVQIHVDVQNSGSRAGEEVAQLYIHDNDTVEKLPKEQLQGFTRVSLNPGEKKTVSFSIPAEQLAFWNSEKHDFVVNPATFDVMVGSSSGDIRQKGSFQITTAGEWPASELTARAADTVD
jgi:beta-glucosidase